MKCMQASKDLPNMNTSYTRYNTCRLHAGDLQAFVHGMGLGLIVIIQYPYLLLAITPTRMQTCQQNSYFQNFGV